MKERIKTFLADQNLSAKEFAEKIGVQASSISHIITGRNKPSVELLQKMLRHYPEFDVYWLLTGKNEFRTKHSEESDRNVLDNELTEPNQTDIVGVEDDAKELVSVLCLYKDGSFEKFESRT